MRDARRHTDPLLAPFLAMVATLGLICMPLGASPQQTPATQSNPSQQTQTQQPPAAQPDASQQTQTQQPPAAQPDDSTADQPSTPPGVKNAKDDVNKIGDRGVGKGINFYSLEREIALGKQLAQEVERSAKLVDDPIVVDYVNKVGQNLVRNSDARVPFTIKVIDSDQINAFALPGGFFYVYSGLILHADEESELAGVMGHEIAHVAARHGTRNATKMELTQLAMIPAMIFIPYTWAGYAMYEGMQFAIPLSYLKFSRDAERQADFLGLQYMYKAGYDPNSYITFFEKIQAEEKRKPGSIPKVFADHPPTAERIRNIQEEIARILPTRPEYIVTTSEFDMVKARLRMIQNRSKLSNTDPNKPSLRKRTEKDPTATTGQDGQSDDSAPTLKRRPDSP
ncbi:MAG TPA: M48 family metallopeptidase [Candidatus Acidoferrales bacterium]|nr:M48 family metallopeptidase [Candidatus Acidoferrales bacterium]